MKAFLTTAVILSVLLSTDAYSQQAATDTGAIRIMTYNIKMLPRILTYIHHMPVKRARILPQYLAAENVDVIVLEETFDGKAGYIIKRRLRKTYPYAMGPANRQAGTMFSSGVVILSKYPMKKLKQIKYKQCAGDDCWARKGAMLVELSIKGRTIQVMGTHLQAGGTLAIKKSQYQQIEAMLEQYAKPGVPQILAGDYNTFRKDTVLYPEMLRTLQAEDGPISGDMQYTSDDLVNDMSDNYGKNRPNPEQDIIDYILYKGNGKPHKMLSRKIVRYVTPWDKAHKDLSDHMALIMQFTL
jgi:endonuclease/exonuclease/phosphatase family metal-dependent hydrolase